MNKKICIFAVIFFIASQCIACSGNISVNDIPKNRKHLNGEIINVKGVLASHGGVIKICQEALNDDCIDLEYTVELSDSLLENVGKKVLLEGIYKEHEYVDTGRGLSFVPSRISVTSFRSLFNN